MNKKGFTLIELLAVIVILAIIALIATPIVLGIIEDARESSKERSAELVVNAIELAYQTSFAMNGKEPTLPELAAQIKKNGINKASVYVTSTDVPDDVTLPEGVTLPAIATNDGVYCTLTKEEGTSKLKVACSGFGRSADFNNKITMSAALSE